MRSLATVLARMPPGTRVVARQPGTTTAAFLADRGLVDVAVDLPPRRGHRVRDRGRAGWALVQLARRTGAPRGNGPGLAAIHANGLAEWNLAVPAAVVARCPIVVWVHEWEVSPWTRRLAPILRVAPILRATQGRTHFAVVSEQSREMVLEAGLAAPDRVTVVANPVDPDDVCGQPAPVPAPAGEGAPFRVGYIGTPARYKGFDLLPALVRATAGLRPAVEWAVYAGPEEMMPEVFAELRALGVALPGKVLDVARAYAACDTVIVPSRHESFGRVVVEAMLNGLPVVAADLPPIRQLVGGEGEGAAGLLFPVGDVGAAAAALARLADDAELRSRLGAAGIRRAQRFAPEPIAAQLRHLYGI